MAACGLAFFFAATAARDGHDWGGDYAQYILHAQNLLEGKAYAPITGIIPNSYLDWMVPAYPPLYPLFIVPILALFGLSFVALKVQIAAFLATSVGLFGRLARNYLPATWALGAIAFMVFSPFLLKYSNKVLTEIPYMAVSFAALIAAQSFFDKEKSWQSASILLISMISLGMTRSLGVSFILAIPAYALVSRRSHFFLASALAAAATATLLAISWSMIGFYVEETGMSLDRILVWMQGKPAGYFLKLGRFLALYPKEQASFALTLNGLAATVYLAFTALGILKRRRFGVVEAYLIVYLMTIYVYAIPKTRYLFPVIPLLSLYAFHGLRWVVVSLTKARYIPRRFYRSFRWTPALVYTPLFLIYWGAYTFRPVTAEANVMLDPNVQDIFEHTRTEKMTGAIFGVPRILNLHTGMRSTCAFNASKYWKKDVVWDLEKLMDLSSSREISHMILSKTRTATGKALDPIVQANPGFFEQTYENPGYEVFKIKWQLHSKKNAQLLAQSADKSE
jgi:hypothetical protein